ncbi:MAG: hypothetical protein KC800_12410 [Candidatus Eremiobacteraeota bacterium]|nr:hypothetical protein [Candidatus Eremiobacteraeota bacterium]
MKRRVRGLTVPEILVTAVLLGALMQLVITTLNVLNRSKIGLMVRTEPRQQLRSFVIQLQNDLRSASYIYPPDTYPIMGTDVIVPDVDTTGNGVIFALPQNSAGPPSFKVCSAFIRPRQKNDIRNPDAYEAVYYYVENVTPSLSIYPSEIDPTTLTGGSLKVFDAYIDGPTGFRSQLTPSGFGINFQVDYKRTPIKGDTTAQKLSSTVVMRNGI